MKIIFAGSPAIAVSSLKAIFEMEAGGCVELAGILTNPDSAHGRKGHTEATEVSVAAGELSTARVEKGLPPIAQLKFEKMDAKAREETLRLDADLLVTFAYGKIFGPKFLALFPLGGLNVHPSLLPRYRGPTPIPAAILNRDTETGITIQKLSPEMDEGDILVQEKITLNGKETTASLSETAAALAAKMLPPLLIDIMNGNAALVPQKGEVVYCPLIAKEDGLIDWGKNADDIDAQVRAYTPWPLSFTMLGEKTIIILEGCSCGNGNPGPLPEAMVPPPGTVTGIDRDKGILIQTGDGVYAVSRLQWQTKKPLGWKDFLNGACGNAGTVGNAGTRGTDGAGSFIGSHLG